MAGSNEVHHFGIRGMHWGVRRQRAADGRVRGPSSPTVKVFQEGNKLTSEGGSGRSASSDAIRAQAYRQAAAASGTHSLSNQELQHLVSRMNLEQQYSRLTSGEKTTTKLKERTKIGKNVIKETIGVALMAKQVHEIANSAMVKDISKEIAKHKGKKGG